MADLDFKHSVSQIPAGEALPEPIKQSVGVETSGVPNYQAAFANYAENTNWMSALGSKVATEASQALAKKMGTEFGKNPQGELSLPPLTDFDKTFAQSYATQAQATLGLQANKLISEANIQMAQAPKITPELITATNHQISLGLKNIFQNAPSEIRPQLEYQYNSLQVNQTENFMMRMLKEQKEDRQNNLIQFSKVSNQNLYSMAISGNDVDDKGDSKSALASLKSIKEAYQAAHDSHDFTAEQKQVAQDSAEQSYLSGKYTRLGREAIKNKKLDEFLANLADNPPKDISPANHPAVYQNVLSDLTQQVSLKAHQENFLAQQMINRIAAGDIPTGVEFSQFAANVSPLKAEQVRYKLIEKVKSNNSKAVATTELIKNWGDAEAQANATPELQNAAFNEQVKYIEQNNPNISHDMAQVQVAASAGAQIPVFKKILDDKLLSTNPNNILSASTQMAMLDEMEQARVYEGVSQKGKAIATLFNQQRGSMPDTDLARQITDNLSNVDETMRKTLDNNWNLILSAKGAAGLGAKLPLYKFALQEVDSKLARSFSGQQYFAVLYGNDLYNQLKSNFDATRGDYTSALKMTQDYYKQHYGTTYINGPKQITDSPIEKYLGYDGSEITPFIQQDLLNQLSESFIKSKNNNPNDYWEVLPLKGNKAELIRHVKTKKGKEDYRYPINLVGRAGNQWDVTVETPYGNRNLFLVAPQLGVTTYTPNKREIDKNFAARSKKGWFGL